jgi:hypothetical protein
MDYQGLLWPAGSAQTTWFRAGGSWGNEHSCLGDIAALACLDSG